MLIFTHQGWVAVEQGTGDMKAHIKAVIDRTSRSHGYTRREIPPAFLSVGIIEDIGRGSRRKGEGGVVSFPVDGQHIGGSVELVGGSIGSEADGVGGIGLQGGGVGGVEIVLSVGIGGGGGQQSVATEEGYFDVGQGQFAGVLDAVFVGVDPEPVADFQVGG